MSKKKTHEEFLEDLKKIHGDKYTVLGEYSGSRNKILAKCNDCGHEWSLIANSLLQGSGCPECAKRTITEKSFRNAVKYKKTHEQFLNEMKNTHKNKIIVLGNYINNKTKILVKCKDCGLEWSAAPSNIVRSQGCPRCIKHKKKTHNEFLEELKCIHGNKYVILEKYINRKTKLLVKCNDCQQEWKARPSDLLKGYGCPFCSKQRPIQGVNDLVSTHPQLAKEWHPIRNKKLNPQDVSHGSFKKVWWQCDKGHEWKATINSRVNLRGCPYCRQSHGEKIITSFLNSNKIIFNVQCKFSDCINKNPLPFDFAVFDDNNDLKCLIEFDGEQHFKPIKHFGGKEKFNKQQHNDQIKTDYCKEHHIPLLRITYEEIDFIEEILTEFIKSIDPSLLNIN